MSVTIHIPPDFKDLSIIKKIASSFGVSITHLHPESLSLKLVGIYNDVKSVIKSVESIYKESKDIIAIFKGNKPKNKIEKRTSPYIRINKSSEDVTKHNNLKSFTPVQLAKIYGFPQQKTNEPANIAIIELGGGYKAKDLTSYWDYLGINHPNVIPIAVDGVGNSPGEEADIEVVLDIQVVGGIIPNSNIYVYFAPNTDQGFYDAIHSAIYDTVHKPSVISISWGGPESQWKPDHLQAYNDLFRIASQKGINICVASGDNGAEDGIKDGRFHVDFPASSPYVLACGGTTLTCPSGLYIGSHTKEICWGTVRHDGAAGGGYSNVFPVPSYQKLLPVVPKMRGVPDVVGNADPMTGWIILQNGVLQVIGGTSAVAPMWAAYLALLNVKTFVNDILYKNAKIAFHDITKGDNQGYLAGIGWDPATGLGSPNGALLNIILSNHTLFNN